MKSMSTFIWHSICVSPFSSIFMIRISTMTFSKNEHKFHRRHPKRTLDVYLFLYSFSRSMCMYPSFYHIHHHQQQQHQQYHHHKFFDDVYSNIVLAHCCCLLEIFPIHCCYFRCLFPLIRPTHTYE